MNILVNKRSMLDKNGNAEIMPAKHLIQRVVATYPDGRVKTSSGDVWVAKKVQHSEYDLIAIR